MEGAASSMTKDSMLKALGQVINDVKQEMLEIKESIDAKRYLRYDLIIEETKEDLLEVINYHIARGWVPLGGVIIEPDADGRTYYNQSIWLPQTVTLVLQQEDR